MFASHLATLLLAYALAVITIPANSSPVHESTPDDSGTSNLIARGGQTPIPLSDAQVLSFEPYTQYAAAVFCANASSVLAWNCGRHCSANPGFKPVAAGGDGAIVQRWFVGYDPNFASVIVSFQGADPSKIIPLLTGADILLTPLPSNLFPGFSSNIRTHMGFAHAHELSAAPVLAGVKKTMSQYNATHVTVVGHSLGGAIATISIAYLKLNLPPTTTFNLINYGSPRVGNQGFVDYVNENFPGAVSRIVNRYDVAAALFPQYLGFAHIKGEIHILNNLTWVSCPGQDNPNPNCAVGYVPSILSGTLTFLTDGGRNDHLGPYGSVRMTC